MLHVHSKKKTKGKKKNTEEGTERIGGGKIIKEKTRGRKNEEANMHSGRRPSLEGKGSAKILPLVPTDLPGMGVKNRSITQPRAILTKFFPPL